jgi:hypothetical protein
MEFFLGVLAAVSFFIAFFLGTRYSNKKPIKIADEEEQRISREHRKAFMSMMNYDVDVALQKKKVT